jgi:hypothetical protein
VDPDGAVDVELSEGIPEADLHSLIMTRRQAVRRC